MSDPTSAGLTALRAGYDTVAEEYARRFDGELAHKPFDRARLDTFAARVQGAGPVADLMALDVPDGAPAVHGTGGAVHPWARSSSTGTLTRAVGLSHAPSRAGAGRRLGRAAGTRAPATAR